MENDTRENVESINEDEMVMPQEYTEATTKRTSSSVSILLGVLIVLLILVLAGLYVWSTTLEQTSPTAETPVTRPTIEENNEPESTTAEAQVETLETVSTSDEIFAIEADLESTHLDSLDAELNAIDAELDSAGI